MSDYSERLKSKRDEIEEHIRAMTEPTRVYSAQLPLFPEIYKLEVEFVGAAPPDGRDAAPIRWESPKPKPGGSAARSTPVARVRTAAGAADAAATIRLDYRLHTYNRMQHEQDEYRFWQTVAAVVLLPTTLFAGIPRRAIPPARTRARTRPVAGHRRRRTPRARIAPDAGRTRVDRAAVSRSAREAAGSRARQ